MTTISTTTSFPSSSLPSHTPSPHSKSESETAKRSSGSSYQYDKQLLRTGEFADCTLTSRGRSWHVHRNILAPRCQFFRCCFDGRFSEAGTRVIAMEDDDPTAVEGMLHYLYTLAYPKDVYLRLLGSHLCSASGSDSGIEEGDDDDDDDDEAQFLDLKVYWTFDLLMHAMADKYGLPDLREMAAQSLLRKAADLATAHSSVVDAAKEGEGEASLKQSHKKLISDGFALLIHTLYSSTDEEANALSPETPLHKLRSQIVTLTAQTVAAHIRNPAIMAIMADVPAFAIDLVETVAQATDKARTLARQREQEEKEEEEKKRCRDFNRQRRQVRIPMNEESDCDD